MTELTVIANAKLNLYLDITGVRHDWYHLIESVMQSVDLCDVLTIRKDKELRVTCSDPLIPQNEGNICYKAAKLFFEALGVPDSGVEIHIEKRIPHGAGLGGGSADAAAALIGLNRLYGGAVSEERLSELGAKVGADVPFCLAGGVRLCTGIGEILQDIEPFPERAFLVVMPDFRCDTKAAYARYDAASLPKAGGLAEFVNSGAAFPQKMYNVFRELYADERIEKLCGRLSACGAEGASLTGSGAAVFGVFKSADKAANAAKAFPEFFTAVCKPVPTGTIIVDS